MIPRATYRVQFHAGFGFADAQALIPYLDDLGISHIYASPITTATKGSTHGYDVVDPTRINPELGGEDGFRALVAALRARDMGVIIDIVPNHMGVASNDNRWWNDVLRHGPQSEYARFFDIDWRERLILPILGSPLDQALDEGAIRFDRGGDTPAIVLYDERRLPLRPEDRDVTADNRAALESLLERQHYRLAWWRTADDTLNWRRFFTISDLAGLRVEDRLVFDALHALYFRLYAEGLIDGVRVDHVDGLTDPAAYCRTLRERFDAIERTESAPPGPAYIVIEKILAPGEQVPADWRVDGTSGYDFMADVTALLHAPAGEAPLTRLWCDLTGGESDFHRVELRARQDMLAWGFEGQLVACVEAFAALARSDRATAALTRGMIRRAIERALWVFPVYRTYGTGDDAPPGDAAVRETVRRRAARFTPPGEAVVLDRLLAWLAGTGPGDRTLAAEAVRRFQQLSAPIAAKAVEDTAFYRDGRLLSLADVGSDPARFSRTREQFLDTIAKRAATHPHTMLTTATHDHKRGEDVRARLAVLSEIPGRWRDTVAAWEAALDEDSRKVDPADRYTLYQTLYAAFPEGLDTSDRDGLSDFADRVIGWQQKALREGKQRSSWAEPDEGYEARCATLTHALLDPKRSSEFLNRLASLLAWTAAPASLNSLAQTALRYLLPGVPDCYQGAELADLSLVDPDNRRPVDYALRQKLLRSDTDGIEAPAKLYLIRRLLTLRQENATLFAEGRLAPVEVAGQRKDHVFAFERILGERSLLCAVAIRCAEPLVGSERQTPPCGWWADTRLLLDGGKKLDAAKLLRRSPIGTQWISPHGG